MVIDWEHHFTTKKFAEVVKGEVGYRNLQMFLANKYPIDVQVKDMDAAGIEIAVLTGAPRNLEESRIFNDETAKWVQAYPDRFIGLAHTVPTGGEEALEELDRAIKDLELKGCKIMSCIDSAREETSKDAVLLHSQELYPFYKKITELDIPLFVHPAYFPLFPHAFPIRQKPL